MEGFQQKRSFSREKPYRRRAVKISDHADSILTKRALGEGNGQVRTVSCDFSSCSSDRREEDSFALELRRRSWKQAGGTPMKQLLAEELSKEMEATRRPPSVIARLMGLDALPPQQPIHKQQKKFSEDYLRRTASIGFKEKSPSYESRSFRTSIKEHQEFKDVFEVSETPKVEKNSNSSVYKGTENLKPSEVRMELIRQKFMEAKRLSTAENFQHSKEFHDALEVLDSNKDLLLKFLQEPDSLFTKHLQDLHGVPSPSQSGHITIVKSSNPSKHEKSNVYLKSARKNERADATHSLQKQDNGLVSRSFTKHVHNSHKLLKPQFDVKDETCQFPTQIVVLKPNLAMIQDTARSVSSESYSGGLQSDYRKTREYPNSEDSEFFEEVREWKKSSNNVVLFRQKSNGSREIAREITRQMRHSVSSRSVKVPSSGFRGYAGDESKYNISRNDSPYESEVVAPTSRHLFDSKDKYSPLKSYSTESSVSREAKKRLSQRWKMTQRFQEVRLVDRGNTLGEMLAMSDSEMRPTTLDSIIDQNGSGNGLTRNDGVARWSSPSGISSKDGWKDGCARNLPRSRSLPASSTAFGSPETSVRHRAFGNSRHLFSREAINQEPNKSRKGYSNQKEVSFPKNLRSSSRKPKSSLRVDEENNDTVPVTHLSRDEPMDNLEEKGLSEQKPSVPEPLVDGLADARLFADKAAVEEPEDAALPLETPAEQQPESTACIMLVNVGDFSTNLPDDSFPEEIFVEPPEEGQLCSKCPVPEPESPSSSKEADQPSPVSVLEPPFVEEILSGSECFERVSADLHGLRMQLELLKLEPSDAYSDEPEMIVSSDEESGEGSVVSSEKGEPMGMFRAEKNRDFSYIVDVLDHSGFHHTNREVISATYYSPEFVVHRAMFEKLEKKHGDQMTWRRSERRLLFDRINLGLSEILRPFMDPHPWVKTMMTKLGRGYCEEPLEEELWKLLSSQGKRANEDTLTMALDREMNWLELGDDIDAVGREIERLLIDELVAEVVSM